jgi:tRNA dimethylallyltransferase
MLSSGWLEEVERLAGNWDMGLPAFDAVGYRELYAVIRQTLSLEDAKLQIVRRTRQYAKRQVTWFSHQGQWLWVSPENDVTLKISSGLAAFAENKSA